MSHEPVLLKESIDFLVTQKDGIYFDGTVGFGGHSEKILNTLAKIGKLIATDKDKSAFEYCKNKQKRCKYNWLFTSSKQKDISVKLMARFLQYICY